MKDQYYLQDRRQYVGNDILWWAIDGKGYTTDVSKAHVYTKKEAVAQHQSRETDIPWPKDYIDTKIRPVVDMQNADRDIALQGTGIKLIKPKPYRKDKFKCNHCGRYITEKDFYLSVYHGHPCSRCEVE